MNIAALQIALVLVALIALGTSIYSFMLNSDPLLSAQIYKDEAKSALAGMGPELNAMLERMADVRSVPLVADAAPTSSATDAQLLSGWVPYMFPHGVAPQRPPRQAQASGAAGACVVSVRFYANATLALWGVNCPGAGAGADRTGVVMDALAPIKTWLVPIGLPTSAMAAASLVRWTQSDVYSVSSLHNFTLNGAMHVSCTVVPARPSTLSC